jgi:sulfite reductase (NADPH) flavoprotein alpha-component
MTTMTYSKTTPFPACLKKRYRLTGEGSSRSTWHLELDVTGSGLHHKPGDAVGVFAENDPDLVARTLLALGLQGEAAVRERKSGEWMAARTLLVHHVSIHKGSRRILQILQEAAKSNSTRDRLNCLLDPAASALCDSYLEGRALWDLLEDFPSPGSAQAILDVLPALTPRFYSIASSPLAHPNEIHLTVADVSYFAQGVERFGVCSHFLSSGAAEASPIPIFLFPTQRFVLPSPATPIIMIGPGTGLAPFRAFIQHRIAEGAAGPMWLFFGERHAATDFYYQEELCRWQHEGHLKLTTAFSRDQQEKVYVQHRLRQHANEVWSWIQQGAVIYVCGDAKVMAKDVQRAFIEIAQQEGGLDAVQSSEWLRGLKTNQQYREDVY